MGNLIKKHTDAFFGRNSFEDTDFRYEYQNKNWIKTDHDDTTEEYPKIITGG